MPGSLGDLPVDKYFLRKEMRRPCQREARRWGMDRERQFASDNPRCSRCGCHLTPDRRPSKGSVCLDCRRARGREHYRANREYYLTKARRRQKQVIEDVRSWLISYLENHPCIDCGITDIRVLEFDHREGAIKRTAVSVLARSGYSLETVADEVAKCDVRCANCHRIRTHAQRGWWGAPGGIRTPKPSDP